MPDISRQRVAVIGATGFVGTQLVRRLTRQGAEVFSLSRQRRKRTHVECRGRPERQYPIDMAKPESVGEAIAEIRPDIVFHTATARSEQDWRALISVNVTGSIALLETCAKIDGLRLITFGSSLEMFGAPTSAYGASRSIAAELMLNYARAWSVDLTHIRTGSVYGPGMSNKTLIPAAIRAGLQGTTLSVAPDDVKRNYVEVDDLIDAGLAALKSSTGDIRVVNAVCPNVYSAREVSSIVAQCLNRPIAVKLNEGLVRAWDRFDWAKDTGPAEDLLGWRARISFPDGVERLVRAAIQDAENGSC